jgi:hypothetical protein
MRKSAPEAERLRIRAHHPCRHARPSAGVPESQQRRLEACIGRFEASLVLDAGTPVARACGIRLDGEVAALEARLRRDWRAPAGQGSTAWSSCTHSL